MLDAIYSTTLAIHASCENFSPWNCLCMLLNRDLSFCLFLLWILLLFGLFRKLGQIIAHCFWQLQKKIHLLTFKDQYLKGLYIDMPYITST